MYRRDSLGWMRMQRGCSLKAITFVSNLSVIPIWGPPKSTHAQNVTNLQQTCSNAVSTTCEQDVFALLVPSLLTSFSTCYKAVETELNVLTGCSNNLLSSCNSTVCQQVVSDYHVATW
jgi:hypothetical protein